MQRSDVWRVATFNIWNRQGPWAERLAIIVDELGKLDLDAVGFQEVLGFTGLPSQAHEIAQKLGWQSVHHVPAWNVGGGLTFGNAIISRHALRDQQTLQLPSPPGLDTRTAAFARVECESGPMPVFCTHLTYQADQGRARCEQVRVLTDHVVALCPVDEPPPVLLGDFNADPDSDEMRFMRGLTPMGGASVYYSDAWTVTGNDPNAGFTYDRRNAYALRSREHSRRIDYVFVRGPGKHLCGEAIGAQIALNVPRGEVWPSDHYAVVAEIYAAKRHHDPW
ncbi:MAG TPA: endonuclease/exonuclease/phosphatase family protein [Kofleriaceae bacterium]